MAKENMTNSGFVEIDGYKLHYRIEGDGPTAFVIGSSVFYARSFSRNLRAHLRLIFVDWRGFADARSASGNSEITIDTLLNDIDLIRQKLCIEQFIVVGHSAHAILALEYAKKYTKHVSHVVMIGMSPNLSPEHAKQAEHHWRQSASHERKGALEHRIKNLSDDRLDKFEAPQRFVRAYVRRDPQAWFDFRFVSTGLWEGVLPNMTILDNFYGNFLSKYDVKKGLKTFSKPVFLAMGKHDFIVAPASAWEPYVSSFQNLTIHIFERSGHSPQYEEPKIFDEQLTGWLKKSQP